MRRSFLLLTLLLLVLATPGCGEDVQSLDFSPGQLPGAQVRKSYGVTITVSNNKTPVEQMSIVDGQLPRGLVLHYTRGSSTAEISGTPKEAGTSTFAISASCLGTNTTGQQGRRSYELAVK